MTGYCCVDLIDWRVLSSSRQLCFRDGLDLTRETGSLSANDSIKTGLTRIRIRPSVKIAIGQPRICYEFIESFHAVQNDKPNHADTCRLLTSVALSMDESIALNGNIAGESVTLLSI